MKDELDHHDKLYYIYAAGQAVMQPGDHLWAGVDRGVEMRTHVTFQANFSKAAEPSAPAGRDLARFLATHLDAAGFAAGRPEAHEGYAYTFTCRRAGQTFVVFVALVDDGPLEWLVYAEPNVGAVTRWLQKAGIGRARKTDPPLLRDLCVAIHQCLQANYGFRSVRWYTAAGWDTNPETGWTRAP
jgi:hypothetical protein